VLIDPTASALPALVSQLAVAAALFLGALLLAETAVRRLRVPRIAALVISGAFIAWLRPRLGLAAAPPVPAPLLEALASALLFEVGQRVPLGWIRANPWIVAASFLDAATAFLAVFVAVHWLFGHPRLESLFVASLCMAASPVVVLSVSKDLGARGQVTERALLVSTLTSVYAALLLQVLESASLAAAHAGIEIALAPLVQLAGAFVLGAVAAALLRVYAFLTGARGAALTVGMLSICLLLYAAAVRLGFAPVVAALFFGLVVRATDTGPRLGAHESTETSAVLAMAYFILLGAALVATGFQHGLALALGVAAVRLLAKVGVHTAFAMPSALRPVKGAVLGLALCPLTMLAPLLGADADRVPGLRQAVDTCAAVVLVLAILGPISTEIALRLAREPTRRRA
jgi:NhaP-type Na+/H+ or K+/H+ antiporter